MNENNVTNENVKSLVDEKVIDEIRTYFEEHNAVDLAEEMEELDVNDVLFIFRCIPKDIVADIFTYFSNDKKEEIISAFTGTQIHTMIENVYFDDMVDAIQELPANLAQKILASCDKQQREIINQLLSYKEGTAGSIMNVDFIRFKDTDTVAQAIEKIKKFDDIAETVNYCYVTDKQKNLKGQIELYDIMFESPDAIIGDLMDIDYVSVKTTDDQGDVADIFTKYDINVLPVTNDENKLIGIITVDDIIDVIEEETTEDIHHMSGVGTLEDSYLESGILDIVKSRLPWLLILMISATFTGLLLSSFEEQLGALPILTTFIPMLMGTGGNAGGQASTTVIRAISVDGVSLKDIWKVFWKEFRVSIICGIVLCCVNVVRVMILTPDAGIQVALVMSVTLLFTVMVAKCVGGLLPIIIATFKLDPASVVAPFITTVSDAVSLIIYLNLATIFLGL